MASVLNRLSAAFLVLLALTALALTPAAAGEFLYVENSHSGDVSVIDVPEHRVVSTVDVGEYPDSVVPSTNGRWVYLSRSNGFGMPGAPTMGRSGQVVAINTRSDEVSWRVSFGGWPHHVQMDPRGRLLYVALYDSAYLLVVDVGKHRIVDRIPLGFGGQGLPHMLLDLFYSWFMGHQHGSPLGYGAHGIEVHPRTGDIYVGSMITNLISVLDDQHGAVIDRIRFKNPVRPFVFSRDGSRLYVQLSSLHGFKVVDPNRRRTLDTVELPDLEDDVGRPWFYPHTVNHGIGVSPDGRYLLAAGSLSGYVAVYRHPSLEFVKTIPVGDEPNWIDFSGDSRYAYVSNRASNSVSVISLNQLAQVRSIPVGTYPQRMTVVDVPGRN